MAVSGLLTQKPTSPAPEPGETRRFTVEQKPKRNKPDETWNKLKNESEGFGSAYKILKADRLDDYTHPQHGTFHQFSLLLEPNGDAGVASSDMGGAAPATSTNKDAEIARAVAFKGAIELAAAEVGNGAGADAQRIEELTDLLLPIVTGQSGNAPAPTEGEQPKTDDDIPF